MRHLLNEMLELSMTQRGALGVEAREVHALTLLPRQQRANAYSVLTTGDCGGQVSRCNRLIGHDGVHAERLLISSRQRLLELDRIRRRKLLTILSCGV